MRRLSTWLDGTLEQQASTRSVALLRIGLALLILVRFGDTMRFGPQLTPLDAWIRLAFWASTIAMLGGLRARLATAATALATIAAAARGLALHQQIWKHHHVYLLLAVTVCATLTPNGRSYSLDRWLAIVRSEARGEAVPQERGRVGFQYLMAVQLSAVYFWGAVNKTTLGWLSGDKLESQLLFHIFDSDPPDLLGWHAWMAAASIGAVILEYSLAIGLWFRRARYWLVPIGIVFHTAIYVTLPVSVFSALSCLLYLAYFEPNDVHRAIERLSSRE
jgi:hypothetical protein